MTEKEQAFSEQELARIRDCIRIRMMDKGVSYEALAEKMGFKTPQTVYNYFSSKPLSRKIVQKFAEALDYPYELLVKGEQYHDSGAYAALEARVREMEETIREMKKVLYGK